MGRGARGVAAGSGAPRWRLVWSAAAKSFQLLRHRPVSVRPSGDLARGPLLVAGRVCCSAWTARGTLNPLWEAALQKQELTFSRYTSQHLTSSRHWHPMGIADCCRDSLVAGASTRDPPLASAVRCSVSYP